MEYKELVEFAVSKMDEVKVMEDALQMKRYMKDHFEFYGVKSPARKTVQKELKVFWKKYDNETLFNFVESLWALPQRELQYIAIDTLDSRSKKWDASYLHRVENLIVTKSWWDTVDGLAANIVGSIFFRNRDAQMEWVEKWNNSENMWLNRSALIHQLRYKTEVDLELLFALVESHIGSKVFFINKASGWALRQASKFYPNEVKQFISDHPQLSNLTKKEGSKYIN